MSQSNTVDTEIRGRPKTRPLALCDARTFTYYPGMSWWQKVISRSHSKTCTHRKYDTLLPWVSYFLWQRPSGLKIVTCSYSHILSQSKNYWNVIEFDDTTTFQSGIYAMRIGATEILNEDTGQKPLVLTM